MASGKCQHLLLPLNWLKPFSQVRSLGVLTLFDGLSADLLYQLCSHTRFSCFYLTCNLVQSLLFRSLVQSVHWNVFHLPPRFTPTSEHLFVVCPSHSAIVGHRLNCLCGHHPGVSLLLLCLQKMDIQEEKQKEGERQGQKCHQHEGRHRWGQNRGNDFFNFCY